MGKELVAEGVASYQGFTTSTCARMYADALGNKESELQAMRLIVARPSLAFHYTMYCTMPLATLTLYDAEHSALARVTLLVCKTFLWVMLKLFVLQGLGLTSGLGSPPSCADGSALYQVFIAVGVTQAVRKVADHLVTKALEFSLGRAKTKSGIRLFLVLVSLMSLLFALVAVLFCANSDDDTGFLVTMSLVSGLLLKQIGLPFYIGLRTYIAVVNHGDEHLELKEKEILQMRSTSESIQQRHEEASTARLVAPRGDRPWHAAGNQAPTAAMKGALKTIKENEVDDGNAMLDTNMDTECNRRNIAQSETQYLKPRDKKHRKCLTAPATDIDPAAVGGVGRPHKGMDPEKVSKRGAGKDLEKVIRNINNAPHGNNDQEQVNDKVVDSAAGGGNSIAKQGKARTRQSDEKQVPNIKRNRKKPDPTPITQGERDEAAQKIIIAFSEFKESRHDKRGKGRRQRGEKSPKKEVDHRAPAEEDVAAIKIQATWRGSNVRRDDKIWKNGDSAAKNDRSKEKFKKTKTKKKGSPATKKGEDAENPAAGIEDGVALQPRPGPAAQSRKKNKDAENPAAGIEDSVALQPRPGPAAQSKKKKKDAEIPAAGIEDSVALQPRPGPAAQSKKKKKDAKKPAAGIEDSVALQ